MRPTHPSTNAYNSGGSAGSFCDDRVDLPFVTIAGIFTKPVEPAGSLRKERGRLEVLALLRLCDRPEWRCADATVRMHIERRVRENGVAGLSLTPWSTRGRGYDFGSQPPS
jgi:hypothetical protein